MVELLYNSTRKRWMADDGLGFSVPLGTGSRFAIYVGSSYYMCKLEFDTAWYIRLGYTKFRLHPKEKYVAMLLSKINDGQAKDI